MVKWLKGLWISLPLIAAIILLTVLIWILSVQEAAGANCVVPSDNYPSIQDAIDAGDCEKINLGAELYTENLDVDRNVEIRGQGITNTVIDGNAGSSVFTIQPGIIVTLSDMSIRNGSAISGAGIYNKGSILNVVSSAILSNTSPSPGAGIYNDGGHVIVLDSILSGNTSDGLNSRGAGAYNANNGFMRIIDSLVEDNFSSNLGGGIANWGSRIEIINSTLRNNRCDRYGGAIYNSFGTLTVTDSIIHENWANYWGGGIASYQGNVHIANSLISNNSYCSFVIGPPDYIPHCWYRIPTSFGGGIKLEDGSATVISSTIANNYAEIGGGIQNNGGSLQIVQSTIAGNVASNDDPNRIGGGGIHNWGGTITLTNSTLSANSVGFANGGAIYNAVGLIMIYNSTLSQNSALWSGGGVYNSSGSMIMIKNSIVADNRDRQDCAGDSPVESLGHNIDSDNTCNLTASGDIPQTNPHLAPLADFGGPSLTHALLPSSPAIDAGDDAVCNASPVNGVDQRGISRPQGEGCDIGASEGKLEIQTMLPFLQR